MLINYVDTQITFRLKDKISTETRERLSYISCALLSQIEKHGDIARPTRALEKQS